MGFLINKNKAKEYTTLKSDALWIERAIKKWAKKIEILCLYIDQSSQNRH